MTAPFNPAAWLEAFANDGGSYALTNAGMLWLGIVGMSGCDVERHTVHLVGHPERREAIRSHIRERCLIA